MKNLTPEICPYSTAYEMSFINFLSWVHASTEKLARALGAVGVVDECHDVAGELMQRDVTHMFPAFQPTLECALLVGALKLDLDRVAEAVDSGETAIALGSQWIRLQAKSRDGQLYYKVSFDLCPATDEGLPCAVRDLASASELFRTEQAPVSM